MQLIKISLSFIVSFLTVFANAQQSANLNVTLTGWQGDGRQTPRLFDTVFLNSAFNKTDKVYTNISTNDTSFILTNVPIGKYWLLFSTQSFCVSPVPIVICSKCDNQFIFLSSPKKQSENCNTFAMVEVAPMYIGGNKALSKDFQRNLSRPERKKLKASENFIVRFYLTKQGFISDPSFGQSDLTPEMRNLVLKGLINVTSWQPAIRNGRVADVEFSLNKQTLLNN